MGDALPYTELHCHSAFSLRAASSSVEALVARAAELGMRALALTDTMTLAGVVRFQTACVTQEIRPILGAELAVVHPLVGAGAQPSFVVALAANAVGYARLCALLTKANLSAPEAPVLPFSTLAERPEGLILLTGGYDGPLIRLLRAGQRLLAEAVAWQYREAFGREGVYIELQDHLLPESHREMERLAALAASADLRCVVTNGVRHARRADYPVYDLLTCSRLGITVDTPHIARPQNDEAHLKSAREMHMRFAMLPWGPDALAATQEIAARCDLSLLKGTCTAPQMPLPSDETPTSYLRARCADGLATRYTGMPTALALGSPQRRQLQHELAVIEQLDLAEFFLCVAEIMGAARAMGIRCSGRGSAANSLVAYLLGITGVDPIQHGLLFERFLNPDRQGMPDIDVDVQSDRREELIRYVERTYSEQHAAMVANVITYRPRSALRDAAKALGYPLPLINRLSKVLHHHSARSALPGYAEELAQVIRTSAEASASNAATRARCLARLPLLLEMARRLCGLPRHLSLHNGGMVLSRAPLSDLLPVRLSANGVRALEVDKDDVERLGLIKFDLLGLRTLGAIEEALALIEETTGERPDIDHLPTVPPDPATMRLVRGGQTLAVFQIESPGQWHLLAQTQPATFDDLIVQTALFRPGPIQGHFVRPYVERRQQTTLPPQQREAVQTPWREEPGDDFWRGHPVLGAVLRESEGVLLFQEQILEIAHRFAGLSYAEADGFRRAMSHARSPEEMAAMRERFLAGALARGESPEQAERVFTAISHFVGYGFCRSHAAEFARTIYQTAYLKAHYPAHYLAAFLSSQPAGFFPAHVVLEEAKQLGIPVLPPDINRSANRFTVERVGTVGRERWAIRIGLGQITAVGDELARAILWARGGSAGHAAPGAGPEEHWEHSTQWAHHPFTSVADLCQRLRREGLTWSATEALVLAGACDSLAPRLSRRQRLWQLHELWPLVAPARRKHGRRGTVDRETDKFEQLALSWEIEPETLGQVPALPAFATEERDTLDYQLLGMSTRVHPMQRLRRDLRRRGVRAIAELAEVPEGHMTRVAGWCISAQRPPTAKGMGFLVLEDETGRLPVALPPRVAAEMHRVIRASRAITIVGRVERVRWYRSLLGSRLTHLA